MLTSIGLILLGLVLLVLGGETLLRGAVGLATLLRLTPAVIGLTVAGAVIGNVFARRECAAASSPSPIRSPAVVLTEADLQRLSRTVRLLPTRQPVENGNSPANLAIRVSDAHIDRLVEAITSTEHPGVGACARMPGSRRSPS